MGVGEVEVEVEVEVDMVVKGPRVPTGVPGDGAWIEITVKTDGRVRSGWVTTESRAHALHADQVEPKLRRTMTTARFGPTMPGLRRSRGR